MDGDSTNVPYGVAIVTGQDAKAGGEALLMLRFHSGQGRRAIGGAAEGCQVVQVADELEGQNDIIILKLTHLAPLSAV